MTTDGQDIDAPVNPPLRFRKRPVVITAVQLEWSTWSDMCAHAGVGELADGKPQGGFAVPGDEAATFRDLPETAEHVMALAIPTLEGLMIAVEHDWIIRGIAGELYPCKPDIFAAAYEPAEDEPSGQYVTLQVEIATTGKRETVEAIVMRDLDHNFRGRLRVTREDGSAVAFDPVLHDGEPPPGYEPHEMPVVDHRAQQMKETRP